MDWVDTSTTELEVRISRHELKLHNAWRLVICRIELEIPQEWNWCLRGAPHLPEVGRLIKGPHLALELVKHVAIEEAKEFVCRMAFDLFDWADE
jgi:hypothetical protein